MAPPQAAGEAMRRAYSDTLQPLSHNTQSLRAKGRDAVEARQHMQGRKAAWRAQLQAARA